MLKKTVVLVASCGALMAGCGTDVESKNQEIISNLVEAGFPADDIMVVDGAVYVGRDARVTLEASQEMLQRGEGSQEHYRTTNLVDTSLVKKICVNPTAEFNSYSQLSAGLDAAIANYNTRGLRITFARGPTTGCNADIVALTMSGTGGGSGFPSGGRPFTYIIIGTGAQDSGVGLSKHLITHELGHAIGLRHSDYYDRSISCGSLSTGSEGDADLGAIHIPGTPTTATRGGSVMNSCSFSDATGEWTSSDIAALNFLYSNPIDRSESFIRQVYLDVLRREPDPSGFNFHLGTFQSCNGNATCLASQRVAFARGMLESAENRQQDPDLNPASAGYNAAFVTHCYTNFLQRQPAAAEHSWWLSFLNSTGDYSTVVREFITSAEYRQRFGVQ
jgi:hypothetical protein